MNMSHLKIHKCIKINILILLIRNEYMPFSKSILSSSSYFLCFMTYSGNDRVFGVLLVEFKERFPSASTASLAILSRSFSDVQSITFPQIRESVSERANK